MALTEGNKTNRERPSHNLERPSQLRYFVPQALFVLGGELQELTAGIILQKWGSKALWPLRVYVRGSGFRA